MALLVMYQETGDLRYLELSWRFSRAVMARRDDLRGLLDYRKKSLPAWGASKYIPGRRTHFLVHTGLILEPVLETLLALEGRLGLTAGQEPRARIEVEWAPQYEREELLARCLESIDLFADAFRSGADTQEGYYLEAGSRWEPLPFNCQNIFAYDLILAHELSGSEVYLERGRAVLTFFRRRLERAAEGGYIWEYEAKPASLEQSETDAKIKVRLCEEISHGALTVEPLAKLAHLGIVFDRADIETFSRTLSRQIYLPEYGIFTTTVGCGIKYSSNYLGMLPAWLCVTEYNAEAYALVERYMLQHTLDPEPQFLAYLIRYAP